MKKNLLFFVCFFLFSGCEQNKTPKTKWPSCHNEIKAMCVMLKDKKKENRSQMAWELGQINKSIKDMVIPKLIEALNDPEKDVRYQAITALGECGSHGKTALPHLVKILKEKDTDLMLGVFLALYRIDKYKDEVIQKELSLFKALAKHKNKQVSSLAKEAVELATK